MLANKSILRISIAPSMKLKGDNWRHAICRIKTIHNSNVKSVAFCE